MRKTMGCLLLTAVFMAVCLCVALSEQSFYVISFNRNLPSNSYISDTQVKYPGQPMTLSTTYPLDRNHVFLGWSTDPDATEPEYQPGDTFTTDADTVLYAVWIDIVDLGVISGNSVYEISYPVTSRGAYVAFTPEHSGKYVIHSINSYFRTVYSMMELEYGNSSRYFTRVNNDYELLMELEAGTKYYVYYYHVNNPFQLEISDEIYTVSFNRNLPGNSYISDTQVKYPGQSIKLSTTYPLDRDHVFLGWSTDPDAAEPEYQPGDTFTTDADTVLYAVWIDSRNLGSVNGRHLYEISYPVTSRGAYVSFTPEYSGK